MIEILIEKKLYDINNQYINYHDIFYEIIMNINEQYFRDKSNF